MTEPLLRPYSERTLHQPSGQKIEEELEKRRLRTKRLPLPPPPPHLLIIYSALKSRVTRRVDGSLGKLVMGCFWKVYHSPVSSH